MNGCGVGKQRKKESGARIRSDQRNLHSVAAKEWNEARPTCAATLYSSNSGSYTSFREIY
jgi:hypothetical protein